MKILRKLLSLIVCHLNSKLSTLSLSATKAIALIVIACFFVSSVCRDAIAVVSMPEVKVSEYKRLLDDFVLPYSYGKITKSHFAATDRVIINIQDLHCHPQVQKNISNIIELFDKKYGVTNVYLEGAYGSVSTKWLIENIKNNNNKSEILNNILKTGKLTGAEYYSAISGKTEIIKGLENKEPYLDNLKRFGDLLEKQDEIKLILESIEKATAKIKKQYYKRNQIKFERLSKKYEQGKISTNKYYSLLSKYTDKLGIDLSKYENISNYITLLELQKQFDSKTIQKELMSLLSILKQKLSYQEYSVLISKTDNFKKIDILSAYILQILQDYNVNLSVDFPQLDKYFQFVRINNNINPIKLLKEQEQLTAKINTTFCENNLRKEIVFLVNFEKYLKQYLSTKITLDDYEYYKENIAKYKMLYNKYIDNKVLTLLKPYIKETDKFYEINMNRNEYFAQNIFNGIATRKLEEISNGKDEISKIVNNMPNTKRVDIIVTGGFHSQTVTDILDARDVSYIVITPNVQGDIKEAETTYYEMAKQQKEINFQALATIPLSSYGSGNERYKIAVLVETCPKEALELYGEDIINNIKESNITVKKEHIEKARYYIEQIKEDIDVSRMLESDDIDVENLKNLIEQISSMVFDVEDLSEQDLFYISKGIVELLNNKNSNLVMKFFNMLEYELDVIFFRIFDVLQNDKETKKRNKNVTNNIKIAMKKYLELTDYNFNTLYELFCYASDLKKEKLKGFLNFEKNHKNKEFIEENINLINEISLNYGDNDFESVLNLVLNEEYEEFINNNSQIITEIIKQKYNPQNLQEILNFFLEKDKDDIAFISNNVQLYSFSSDTSMAIGWIISRGYDIKYLEKILNKLLQKDSEGNYIYKDFLRKVSLSIHHYLSVYSVISQDMLDMLTDYYDLIDFDYDLITDLFNALNYKLPQEEKIKAAKRLFEILEKYCETKDLIDDNNDTFQIRKFLVKNLPNDFCGLVIRELNKNQKKQLDDKQTVEQISKLSKFIIDNIDLFEQAELSESAFDLLIETLSILNKEEFASMENVSIKDKTLHFLTVNYRNLNKEQKEKINKILTKYISDFIELTENYDDKEISQHSHYLSFWSSDAYEGHKYEKEIEEEKNQENYEKSLRQNIEFIINNKDKLDNKSLNYIFSNNLTKVQALLNIMENYNDFERLNNKVKKMIVNGYIESQVTLKEYFIDTDIKTDIRNGKNPPLIRNKELAKQRNCNDVEQVRKLFVNFVDDEKNNNVVNNKIFKERTGFAIKEVKENLGDGEKVFGKRIVKNEDESIYERDYDAGEILEMYADDIVYAIAQIMKQQDDIQNKFGNESFNDFLKQNGIENDFKCPLFDGPCLVPYSEILNAGYDIGDCTGSLAGGLNNVDFRNNRIYTKNHFVAGYYKDGKLIQKYGYHFDDKDLHIFSLEDNIGFRPGTSLNGQYGGENADLDIDSEGVYFFESIDFILEETNRIGKENGIKERAVYIETDMSNSQYLKHIARTITTEQYSDNYDLLSQSGPNELNKLDPKINLKEKMKEQKKIAQRNRLVRPILNYKITPKNKLKDEDDIARNKIKDNKFTLNPSSYMYNYFIEHFIGVFEEVLPLYKSGDIYAIPINKNEMLKMKIYDENTIQTTKKTSKFIQITDKNRIENLNKMSDLQIRDTNLDKILNNFKESNLKFFSKNKNIIGEDFRIEILEINERDNKVIIRITDGENIYYAEVDIKMSIKPALDIKTVKIDKNIINEDNEISEQKDNTKYKKELLNVMKQREFKFKMNLAEELKKAKEIIIEFPPIKEEKNETIKNNINKEEDIQQNIPVQALAIYKEQLTPNLISWANNNDVKLLVIETNPLNIRGGRIIMNTKMRYMGKNGYLFVFSKEGIGELNMFKNDLEKQFGSIDMEIAEYSYNDKTIISNFKKKYNIISENEINGLVKDNLDIDENIKENTTQTDLIKNILSAA